ncbi:hypothetical protein Taro_030254 [Colocasia esculenta]|uniref:Retinol dehydrogenase 11 n=1 Tax=Colocasia esculenta TaxID=4460 RepID=A0A843W2S9_COLES|nr:hypothetical protein [Colocasia esculenta]
MAASAPVSVASNGKKEGLGWIEWGRGWYNIVTEFLFQRIMASHLENPLSLPPLNDVTCIVTGCTSGIGLQIARQLAKSGAHVVMAVRKTKMAQELIQKWQTEDSEMGPPLNVEVMELDLLSLKSVVRFAEAWNARLGPLHVLINNAGIFSIGEPQHFSEDGYETHMQVNHLAPTLLSMLLMPSLVRGSPSRIINVNSIMHYVGFVDTEDMNLVSGKRKYTSLLGYCNSKLAQVKFSSILQKRLPIEAGIHVLCVSPGIVHTNVISADPLAIVDQAFDPTLSGGVWAPTFRRYLRLDEMVQFLDLAFLIPFRPTTREDVWTWRWEKGGRFTARDLPRIVQAGSRSSLFAATDPQVSEYCELLKTEEWPICPYISHDCRPTNASEEAHNLETSQNVWEKTLELIGLPVDALEKLISGEEVQCKYQKKEA